MRYLGTILALCIAVFGLFALYKYAPDLIGSAVDGANYLANLISLL